MMATTNWQRGGTEVEDSGSLTRAIDKAGLDYRVEQVPLMTDDEAVCRSGNGWRTSGLIPMVNVTGVSLNVTAEVSEPDKVAEAANELFDLVNQLLDEQINKLSQGDRKPEKSSTYGSRSNGHTNGTGNGRFRTQERSNGNGQSNGSRTRNASNSKDRKLTQAQHRAITNMTKRHNEEADAWVQHEFGVDTLDDLTVRQASDFIDTLKTAIEDQPKA